MTTLGNTGFQDLARRVLTSADGSRADSSVLAAAARSAHTSLGHVLIPLIGQAGTNALTTRALHLARREHPWLTPTRNLDQTDMAFELAAASLERQDPGAALEAAVAVLATLAGLLVTFIGNSLTTALLRKAWPDGFSDATEEGRA